MRQILNMIVRGTVGRDKRMGKIVLLGNGVLILLLVSAVLFSMPRKNAEKDTKVIPVEEETKDSMEEAAKSMVNIYGNLIPGAKGELDHGNTMSFGYDGVYSGYFDADAPDINGKYVVSSPDDKSYLANVNVYNEDASRVVQYQLRYDKDRNFELYYPGIDLVIKLNY